MQNKINVKQWVALFEDAGLDENGRNRWHQLFEERYPEGHQSFLEWLGLDAERIEKIKKESC